MPAKFCQRNVSSHRQLWPVCIGFLIHLRAGIRPGGRPTFFLVQASGQHTPPPRPGGVRLPSLRTASPADLANSPSTQTARPELPDWRLYARRCRGEFNDIVDLPSGLWWSAVSFYPPHTTQGFGQRLKQGALFAMHFAIAG